MIEPTASSPITTDVVIVGAGPCGLFQVFELGLLGLKAHLVDALKEPGGQCIELYPDKPIYDIPAVPVYTGKELTDNLMEQIKPFSAEFHLGQEVTTVLRQESGRFQVATNTGTQFDAGAVVIAGGVGSFQPRKLDVPGAAELESPLPELVRPTRSGMTTGFIRALPASPAPAEPAPYTQTVPRSIVYPTPCERPR